MVKQLVLQKPPRATKIHLLLSPLIPLIPLLVPVFMSSMPMGYILIGLGLITSLIVFYLAISAFKERLIIDNKGIHYRSNLPRKLQGQLLNPNNGQFYKEDWTVKWSEIKAAYIRKPTTAPIPGNQFLTLELDMGLQRQHIFLCQWTDSQNPANHLCIPKDMLPWDVDNTIAPECLRHSPLPQALIKQGISLEIEADVDLSTPFYNCLNRYIVLFSLLFPMLLMFPMYAQVGLDEIYTLEKPSIQTNVILSLLTALIFSLWMLRGKIPKGHSLVTGFLLGLTVFVALPSTLLTLNYLTDKNGLQTYPYLHQGEGEFKPLAPHLPNIQLRNSDYWQQFPQETVHEFELRQGGLGFYQVHTTVIDGKIHHYEQK